MDKAYIVANEQQKNKIREKSNDKADFDSQAGVYEFPYVLVDSEADGWILFNNVERRIRFWRPFRNRI